MIFSFASMGLALNALTSVFLYTKGKSSPPPAIYEGRLALLISTLVMVMTYATATMIG